MKGEHSMLVCYTELYAFNVFYMIDEVYLNGKPTEEENKGP